jgi:broad specificity phosphatase PhoE
LTLYVARHGQTDWNLEPARCQGWADVELNETGRAQARARGQALACNDIELIVASHLQRARQTAEIVRDEIVAAGGHDLPLIIDPRLSEAHRGDWETRLFSDIIQEEPVAWRAYREHPDTYRFPGGERLRDQQRRVLAAVRDAAMDERTTLLVTHGGSIRVLRCFLSGKGLAAFHDMRTHNGDVDEVPVDGLVQRIDAFLNAR